MPDSLCDELKRYVDGLYEYPEDARIFPVIIRAVETKMHRQMEKAGMTNIIRVHDLRHSAASFYLSQGADMYAIQRLLGHASIEETIRTYSHFSIEQDRQIANIVNRLNQKGVIDLPILKEQNTGQLCNDRKRYSQEYRFETGGSGVCWQRSFLCRINGIFQ